MTKYNALDSERRGLNATSEGGPLKRLFFKFLYTKLAGMLLPEEWILKTILKSSYTLKLYGFDYKKHLNSYDIAPNLPMEERLRIIEQSSEKSFKLILIQVILSEFPTLVTILEDAGFTIEGLIYYLGSHGDSTYIQDAAELLAPYTDSSETIFNEMRKKFPSALILDY